MRMSDKFRAAMNSIVKSTPYARQMPISGLFACLDDLIWFNNNRGPDLTESQREIKEKTEGIVEGLGAYDGGGIPGNSSIHQIAGKLLKVIYPRSIESTDEDGFLNLNLDIWANPENWQNQMPEEASYIWGVLEYIEGFTYLIPGALYGRQESINQAKELFNRSLVFCPRENYINETL